jgi:hypothetical protein
MAALRAIWTAWTSQEFEFSEALLRNSEAAGRDRIHSMVARCGTGLLLLCADGNQPEVVDPVLK